MRANKQYSDEKMMEFKIFLTLLSNQINTLVSSSTQTDSPKPTDPTTVVPAKSRAPSLDSGHSTKIVVMWNIKHEIISPKLYELIANT